MIEDRAENNSPEVTQIANYNVTNCDGQGAESMEE